jgi:hypothetical protein
MGALIRKRVILTGREFLSVFSRSRDHPGGVAIFSEALNRDAGGEGALDYGIIRGRDAAVVTGALPLPARA